MGMVARFVLNTRGRLSSGQWQSKTGSGSPRGDDLRCAGDGARKADERFGHLQHDPAATLGNGGDIADELQRVPEPLLGVDQDAPSGERFAGP